MACVAEAYLDGSARLQPSYGMKTNVFAYAKQDLKAGQTLDGMGGYAAYGLIENMSDNIDNPGIPICLAENVKVKRDIPRDQKILLSDVDIDKSQPSFDLYLKAIETIPGTARIPKGIKVDVATAIKV